MSAEVTLLPMTAGMYHRYFQEYRNDPDLYMDKSACKPYAYDAGKVDQYIQRQKELNRKAFAIMFGGEMVGELIIRDIVEHQQATLSLSMKNETFKNRGFGTKAELLAIEYVFHELDIPVLYADSILTNTRSQHVLEKVGFRFIKQAGDFKYYRIDR